MRPSNAWLKNFLVGTAAMAGSSLLLLGCAQNPAPTIEPVDETKLSAEQNAIALLDAAATITPQAVPNSGNYVLTDVHTRFHVKSSNFDTVGFADDHLRKPGEFRTYQDRSEVRFEKAFPPSGLGSFKIPMILPTRLSLKTDFSGATRSRSSSRVFTMTVGKDANQLIMDEEAFRGNSANPNLMEIFDAAHQRTSPRGNILFSRNRMGQSVNDTGWEVAGFSTPSNGTNVKLHFVLKRVEESATLLYFVTLDEQFVSP